ncbi:unnamed protein product [Chironomus riparius]|uniref:F-box domain-containing protein n=1 Tax=Chironomus riparius TaxID=315576 RepID=A0A9N9S992_9DIPT|nr:unnamed protein product [Chironomus riparius]
MEQEDFSEATAVVGTNKNLMNYFADFYSTLFHNRREEILVESTAEIDKLPQEILLRILSYLKAKELIALSSTCRRFSNLINTNDFLPKLTLRVTESTKRSQWIGHRKYKKLLVLSESINLYFKLPKTIGTYVTTLNLDCWEISIYEIKKVIKLCPHIKELSLMYLVRTGIPPEITKKEEIPLTWLDKLSLQGELQIVNCLKNLQVKELIIHRQSDFETHLDDVAEFIMNQKDMINLELYHMYFISSLFLRDEMKHVAFRLNKLIIKYCSHFSYFCFVCFVASQKDSIKFMSVDDFGYDMIKFLMHFKEMRTLKLTLTEDYQIAEKDMLVMMSHVRNTMLLPQVEDLEIWNYCHNFIHHFPNVRKLTIYGTDLDLNLWNFKNLEDLTVITKNLENPLELNENLKKLKLIMYEYPKDHSPFSYDSCKLEDLTLIGAKNLDWIKNYLEHPNTNLKNLRIERCLVTDELKEILKIHENKIKRFEIIEQDGKEIEILRRRLI